MKIKNDDLIKKRKEEILKACASLYEVKKFKDISLKDISDATSFKRTSVYNYFQTKEDIFVCLLEYEYSIFLNDINELIDKNESLSLKEYAQKIASILSKRVILFKIISMNLYDIEDKVIMENLIHLKDTFYKCIDAIRMSVKKYFKKMNDQEIESYIYRFFPFLNGLYAYAFPSAKQIEAIKLANKKPLETNLFDLLYTFIYNNLIFYK